MTPRNIPKEWLAIGTLLVTGAVLWTTIRRDVDDSVRVPRFERDSINVDRRLDALERQQREYLHAICKAVRCTEPR